MMTHLRGGSRIIQAASIAGGVVTLCRLRRLALLPRVFLRESSGGTLPDSSPSTARTAIAVAALWGFDKLVFRVLQRLGSRLPSSIAAMLLCVGGLIVVQAVKGTETADRLASFVQPGVVFLGRWLLSFLTCAPLATCAADAPDAGL